MSPMATTRARGYPVRWERHADFGIVAEIQSCSTPILRQNFAQVNRTRRLTRFRENWLMSLPCPSSDRGRTFSIIKGCCEEEAARAFVKPILYQWRSGENPASIGPHRRPF